MNEKNHKDISKFINETYTSVLEQINAYPFFFSTDQMIYLTNFMFFATEL